jgi:hypothetical protein
VTPFTTPSQQKDIGVASATNCTRDDDDGKVTLGFKHALTKVEFTGLYSGTLPGNGTMKVKMLWLNNAAGSGTMHLTSSGCYWDADLNNPATYFLSLLDGDLTGNLLPQQPDAPANISTNQGALLLVPQTTPANMSIQAVGTFFNGTDTRDYEIVPLATPAQTTWMAGETSCYNLVFNVDGKGYPFSETAGQNWAFAYSGAPQQFTAPQDGFYRLEAWGAAGNTRNTSSMSMGGYAAGTIFLKENQVLYVYVGGRPTSKTALGWNGGVGSLSPPFDANGFSAGGGATDFRLLQQVDNYGLNSRILVAGGGGGSNTYGSFYDKTGVGGGLTGGLGMAAGNVNNQYTSITTGQRSTGGSQTQGGTGKGGGGTAGGGIGGNGSFGAGGINGGGGGWYGGGGGGVIGDSRVVGGGGGSSFISGMTGCVAITPTSAANPRAQDGSTRTEPKRMLNYSNNVFGPSLTWQDGQEIIFTNPSMVDGQGYQWNTGAKAGSATGMPNHANPSATMTGNSGNGYARITLLLP